MPTDAPSPEPIAVIVTVEGNPDALAIAVEHARSGLEQHFPTYPGFIVGALHESLTGQQIVQYLRWQSMKHYLACRDDPAWDERPTTSAFTAAVNAGDLALQEATYRVVTVRPESAAAR